MSHPIIPFGNAVGQVLGLSLLSAYGLFLSYHNITRLQAYEKQSEKAAEWSNTAAERLRKTRTTQASGVVSLLLSTLTSSTLLLRPSLSTPSLLIPVAVANAAIMLFARTHMGRFWNEANQTRVPFVQKFNDAVRGSEKVVWVLSSLSIGWVGAAVVWGGSVIMGPGAEKAWLVGGSVVWGLGMGVRCVVPWL